MAISNETRQNLIQTLAERMTDAADMETLIQLFYEDKLEWLENISDEELLYVANNYEVKFDEE